MIFSKIASRKFSDEEAEHYEPYSHEIFSSFSAHEAVFHHSFLVVTVIFYGIKVSVKKIFHNAHSPGNSCFVVG